MSPSPPSSSPSACRATGLLGFAALGSATLWGYLALGFRAGNGGRDVGVFLGLIAALTALAELGFLAARRLAVLDPQRTFHLIFAAGVIFRLLLVPVGLSPSRGAAADDWHGRAVGFQRFLLYDHDVWRYLWDGHLVAHGADPYQRTPNEWERRAEGGDGRALALIDAPPWPDAFEMIAFRDHRTVYPPLAQAAFGLAAAIAPGSVLAWKLLLIAIDLATCGLLALLLTRLGRGRWEVLLYAWNPLVLKEVAGSGHVDALAAFGLTAAALALTFGGARSGSFGFAGLALAGLAKVTPLAATPVFLARTPWRRWWALPAALGLGCLPFAVGLWDLSGFVEGLRTMGARWRFNAGAWDLAVALGESLAAGAGRPFAFALAIGGTLGVGAWSLRDASLGGTLCAIYAMLLAFLLLGPAVMPWYAVGLLPLAVAIRGRAGLAFSALGFVSYLVYIDGTEGVLPRVFEHGLLWSLFAVELCRVRRTEAERMGPGRSPVSPI